MAPVSHAVFADALTNESSAQNRKQATAFWEAVISEYVASVQLNESAWKRCVHGVSRDGVC